MLLSKTGLFALLSAFILFQLGCKQEIAAPPPVIPQVTVTSPIVQTVKKYSLLTGQARASEVFEARARVEGFLEKVEFEEGSLVDKGQLLFEIERKQYQAALDQAKAIKNQSIAAGKLAKANLDRANEANEAQAGTVSAREVDQYIAELAVAEAQALSDDQKIIQAENNLSYTEIYTPFSGMVGILEVDKDNMVGVGDYTLLTTVQRFDPLHIYFDVSETVVLDALARARASSQINQEGSREIPLKIEVAFENDQGYPHKGYLDLLDNVIDPETGTALVRGVIPNTPAAVDYYQRHGKLPDEEAGIPKQMPITLPGAYAQIRILEDREIEDACLIDERAIGTDLMGKYLLVVDANNMVQQYRIETGQLYRGFRHIVRMWNPEDQSANNATGQEADLGKNFSTNFKYIISGLQKARPGKEVKVQETTTIFPDAKNFGEQTAAAQ